MAATETQSFIKQAAPLWSATELDDLKDYVPRNALAGDAIPGTGGLRKPLRLPLDDPDATGDWQRRYEAGHDPIDSQRLAENVLAFAVY
jgi:hypothetical protein